jgi:hypothetical protein
MDISNFQGLTDPPKHQSSNELGTRCYPNMTIGKAKPRITDTARCRSFNSRPLREAQLFEVAEDVGAGEVVEDVDGGEVVVGLEVCVANSSGILSSTWMTPLFVLELIQHRSQANCIRVVNDIHNVRLDDLGTVEIYVSILDRHKHSRIVVRQILLTIRQEICV